MTSDKSPAEVGEKWQHTLRVCRAVYDSGGHMNKPHGVLASEMHTTVLVNARVIMEEPALVRAAGRDLGQLLYRMAPDAFMGAIDMVVGVPDGAVTLAHEVAAYIGDYRKRTCRVGRVSKIERDGAVAFDLESLMSDVRGQSVVLVEDVVTTLGTAARLADSLTLAGARVQPYVLALWNRSGKTSLKGRTIGALVNVPLAAVPARSCLWCAGSSRAVRPKGGAMWRALMSS